MGSVFFFFTNTNTCSIMKMEVEHMYEIQTDLSLQEKLEILSDAAKYDVACTSSGVDRRGEKGKLGNSCAAGICHTFAADGRCVSLLKILMTNHCVYDCKYCVNRCSNDVKRATFTPDDICNLTVEFYKRNYIEGLFLSSAVIHNPEYTMEKMCEALRLLRTKYMFNGYIHVKAIPGAPAELIYSAGLLADRISVNMELPTEEGLRQLAPNKTFKTIMTPMAQISSTIAGHRLAIGKDARMERSGINRYLDNSIFNKSTMGIASHSNEIIKTGEGLDLSQRMLPADPRDNMLKRPFAAAGQSTQMIIGATGETDLSLIRTSQRLYQNYDLKRVFYSGYVPINDDPYLPAVDTKVPLLREHRLYQADWLLRFYGFHADELLNEENPNFDERIDPKCNWALNHIDDFPVEINKASHDVLLRVPGIGPKSVQKIMNARKYSHINFAMLKKMGVVLKRAQYFIMCDGKMLYNIPMEKKFILSEMSSVEHKNNYMIEHSNESYHQLNLFSDFNLI